MPKSPCWTVLSHSSQILPTKMPFSAAVLVCKSSRICWTLCSPAPLKSTNRTWRDVLRCTLTSNSRNQSRLPLFEMAGFNRRHRLWWTNRQKLSVSGASVRISGKAQSFGRSVILMAIEAEGKFLFCFQNATITDTKRAKYHFDQRNVSSPKAVDKWTWNSRFSSFGKSTHCDELTSLR